MIEITKSENHERCGSCKSENNLFDVKIKLEYSAVTDSVTLCGDCLKKLKELIEELEQ